VWINKGEQLMTDTTQLKNSYSTGVKDFTRNYQAVIEAARAAAAAYEKTPAVRADLTRNLVLRRDTLARELAEVNNSLKEIADTEKQFGQVNASLRGLIPATPAQSAATQVSSSQAPVPPGPQPAGQTAAVKDTEFFKEGTKVA
jgi:hypothetical protein